MASPVKTEWTTVAVPGGASYDAYLALPPAGKGPGLVLFQEIFGVNEHIRALAEQYALDGYVVLAPDVFWRQQRRVELGYEGADRQREQDARQLKRGERFQHGRDRGPHGGRAGPRGGDRFGGGAHRLSRTGIGQKGRGAVVGVSRSLAAAALSLSEGRRATCGS